MKRIIIILVVAFCMSGCNRGSKLTEEEKAKLKTDSLLITDTTSKDIYKEVKITTQPTKEPGNYKEKEIK